MTPVLRKSKQFNALKVARLKVDQHMDAYDGITAEEAATICGHTKPDMLNRLWLEKKAGEEKRKPSLNRRGLEALKPVMIQDAGWTLKAKIIEPDSVLYVHPEMKWLTTRLDAVRVYKENNYPMLFKSDSLRDAYGRMKWLREKTPSAVRIEALVQMLVTGAQGAHVFAYCGDTPQYRFIERDEETLERLAVYLTDWHQKHLIDGELPDAYQKFELEAPEDEEIFSVFKEGDFNITGLEAWEAEEKLAAKQRLKDQKVDIDADIKNIEEEILLLAPENVKNIFVNGRKVAWNNPAKPLGAGLVSWKKWSDQVTTWAKAEGIESKLPSPDAFRGEVKESWTFGADAKNKKK